MFTYKHIAEEYTVTRARGKKQTKNHTLSTEEHEQWLRCDCELQDGHTATHDPFSKASTASYIFMLGFYPVSINN